MVQRLGTAIQTEHVGQIKAYNTSTFLIWFDGNSLRNLYNVKMQYILPSQEQRNIIYDSLIFGGMNIHNFKRVNCILQTSSNCSFLITDIFCLIKMKY